MRFPDSLIDMTARWLKRRVWSVNHWLHDRLDRSTVLFRFWHRCLDITEWIAGPTPELTAANAFMQEWNRMLDEGEDEEESYVRCD